MVERSAGLAPFPWHYWDEATFQRHSILLDHAADTPGLLRQLFNQGYDEELHWLLRQLHDYKNTHFPHEHVDAADIARISHASVALLVNGILDVCIDIALSERWYDPEYGDIERNLDILAQCLLVIGGFLRIYQSFEEGRSQHPDLPEFSVQYPFETTPTLFKRLWQHRHYLLPLRDESVPRWRLSRGYTQDTAVERLEFGIVSTVLDDSFVFAEELHQPRVGWDSILLLIHCMARTTQRCNYVQLVRTLGRIWRDQRYISIAGPIWLTAFEDGVTYTSIMRQINMRLRDPETINELLWNLATFLSGLIQCLPPDRFSVNDWLALLKNFMKALERQVCSGNMDQDMSYADLVMMSLGALHILFLPNRTQPIFEMGYQGDISKLNLIGVLSYFSAPSIRTIDPNLSDRYGVAELVGRYSEIATSYVRTTVHQAELERLRQRAKISVPFALTSLRAMSVLYMTPLRRRWKDRLIEVWSTYGRVLGVPLHGRPVLDFPRQTTPFRACASRLCLCYGKRPAHPMRVCIGCWQTFYCSKKCQKEDWDREVGGHKDWCLRQRTA